MKREKVVLAYSGGLDTSVILKWLCEKEYEVICFVGDVGLSEDLDEIRNKALTTGASKVYVEDLREEFVTDFIFPALQGNALYEERYLLGTALARPLLAKAQVDIAGRENAEYVAHGATGKGNDQVRFELAYYALHPSIKIISPWKMPEFIDRFKGRDDLIAYAKKNNIEIKASYGKNYSEDENLMHISHEAGMLEDPAFRSSEDVFSRTVSPQKAPDKETRLTIYFKDGIPVKARNLEGGEEHSGALPLFLYVNRIAGENGIGRIDMVENRFVGIKSRGIYETPGATVLWAAHRDLEGIAMDKEVMRLRDMLIPKLSEIIYNGFWFSPEMDFILSAVKKSQEAIDGTVTVALYKGNVTITGRESPTSLYDQKLSSMNEEGGYSAESARGFIDINAIRLKAHYHVLKRKDPYGWRTVKRKGARRENLG
ncbi:argininosuccinate synthase [candidate division KSB1 bacterium]